MRLVRLVLISLSIAVACCASSLRVGSAAQPTNLVPNGWPKLVSIPRLKVRAVVESISFRKATDVQAPYRWSDVAWYNLGPRPGDKGHAAIIGHLDSTCCPAVFWSLNSLAYGDVVQIAYPSGRIVTFRIMWKKVYANADLPVHWMFYPAKERGLMLLTCAGTFHHDGTGYDHKLLVYGRMILPSGKLG